MSRFIAFAAFAALIAGCSDATVAPKSVHATAASFDGTPPPPPVTGDGDGLFSPIPDVDALAATEVCSVPTVITHYQFVYTTDASTEEPDQMNQVAHIKFDEGTEALAVEDLSHQITIHQKLNEPPPVVDAEGIIAGPNFSFRITSSEGGTLGPEGFLIDVTGILKTPSGSCPTSAEFQGTFPPPPTE
jgi:hypothetical protein